MKVSSSSSILWKVKMACSLAADCPAIESSSFWAMRTASSSTSSSFSGLCWLRLKR